MLNARPKSLSNPITSPVDFISGPSKTSTFGNLLNGNTASFTANIFLFLFVKLNFDNFSPAITLEAIFAKGIPLAKIASRIMAGEKLKKFNLKNKNKNMFAVKEAVFPFNKFPNVDVLLGPEMKSTGEVMGIDKDFGLAYAKSQIASQNSLPTKGLAFISLKDRHKNEGVDLAKQLVKLGFKLCGTEGTANRINKNGIKCKKINKVSGGSPHIIDVLNAKKIALVINTGGGKRKHRIQDSTSLRRSSLINKVPYCTNMSTAYAFLEAIKSLKTKKMEVKSLQEI